MRTLSPILLILLAALFNSLSAGPAATVKTTATFKNSGSTLAENRIAKRLHEIKRLDSKSLTAEQKKNIRAEILQIAKTANDPSGGVYISVGLVLLIILLLIIYT